MKNYPRWITAVEGAEMLGVSRQRFLVLARDNLNSWLLWHPTTASVRRVYLADEVSSLKAKRHQEGIDPPQSPKPEVP